MNLYAAFMNKDTLTSDPISAMKGLHRARRRLEELARCVRSAYRDARADVKTNHHQQGDYLTVFLAPEYFFARECDHHRRFIEQGEKQEVVRGLIRLSQECPDTLIVPGTVPCWRPLYRSDPTKDAARRVKVLTRITDAVNQYGFDESRGWAFATPTKHDANAPPDVRDPVRLTKLVYKQQSDPYIAQNTAYIACNGQALKYHKVGNYKEVHGEVEHAVIFTPGSQQGRFNVGNLRFGLEICLDHNIGIFKAMGGPAVQVQLVVSASVARETSNIQLVTGGVFLHADSQHGGAAAKHITKNGGATTKQRLGTQGSVDLWKITMNDGEIGLTPTNNLALASTNLDFSTPPPVTMRTRIKRVVDRIRS